MPLQLFPYTHHPKGRLRTTCYRTRVRCSPYPTSQLLYPSIIFNPRLFDTYPTPVRTRVPYSEAIPVQLHHSYPPNNPTRVHYSETAPMKVYHSYHNRTYHRSLSNPSRVCQSETVPVKVHNSYPLSSTYHNSRKNRNSGLRQTYPNTVVNLNAYERYEPSGITGAGYLKLPRTTVQFVPPEPISTGVQQTYLQSAQQAAKSTVKNPPRVKTKVVRSNPSHQRDTTRGRYRYTYPPRVSASEFNKHPYYYVGLIYLLQYTAFHWILYLHWLICCHSGACVLHW